MRASCVYDLSVYYYTSSLFFVCLGAPPLWVALDEVVDPQNLGAVLRSARFLGVTGMAVCGRNSSPLNGTVSKASAGAMEAIVVHQVGAMQRFLARAAEEGWEVIGAAAEHYAADVSSLTLRKPTILVMGNEGAGLR